MTGRRLSVRDYKGPRRDGLSFAWLRPFALGLALGLAIALAVFVETRHHFVAAATVAAVPAVQQPAHRGHDTDAAHGSADAQAAASLQATAGADGGKGNAAAHAAAGSAGATGSSAAAALPKYDFYQMLPRSHVLVPAHESEARLAPGAPLDRPGTYFLQIGSYRDATEADRVRAQVQKLGVTVSVQRIVVDAVTWHRVRVGPIRDLAVLNRVRHQLQAGNLTAMIVRVSP
ncbi:MAG TPA: SPOR domain-containing protein [Steroidobacteraceae bacterium]|nr:SPOR domain-containing protein [Steroidobacteraceae bacterium]